MTALGCAVLALTIGSMLVMFVTMHSMGTRPPIDRGLRLYVQTAVLATCCVLFVVGFVLGVVSGVLS